MHTWEVWQVPGKPVRAIEVLKYGENLTICQKSDCFIVAVIRVKA